VVIQPRCERPNGGILERLDVLPPGVLFLEQAVGAVLAVPLDQAVDGGHRLPAELAAVIGVAVADWLRGVVVVAVVATRSVVRCQHQQEREEEHHD
jgi:hypothetical protein